MRSTTHTGAIGYYTQLGARSGMAMIAITASVPNMAYHGARAAGVSTAPISIAVPGEDKVAVWWRRTTRSSKTVEGDVIVLDE